MSQFTTIAFMAESDHGKDFCGKWVTRTQGFVSLAFADHIKRICASTFKEFSEEALWGDAKFRNQDVPIEWEGAKHRLLERLDTWIMALTNLTLVERVNYKVIVKNWFDDIHGRAFSGEIRGNMSPRVALQLLGTEYGRAFKKNIWSAHVMDEVVPQIMNGVAYLRSVGLLPGARPEIASGAIITDCRYGSEMVAVQERGGYVVKVVRNSLKNKEVADIGIKGHSSEAELKSIPDDAFDLVLEMDDGADNVYPRLQKMFDEKEYETRAKSGKKAWTPPSTLG